MKKTLFSGSIATLVTMSSLVVTPIAEAAPVPTPGTIGGTYSVEGQSGQSLKVIGSKFEVEGTATVANYGDTDLPLTQTLKKGRTESWSIGGSADFSLLKLFHVTSSADYRSTQIWGVSQTLDLYPIKPGYTGVLEYGLLNQSSEGTHLTCRGGKWIDTGRPYWGTIPKGRHIHVLTHTNETDRSVDGAAPQVKGYAA